MRDVEIVATLLLFLEQGPRGQSVAALDAAMASRDESWEGRLRVEQEFRDVADFIRGLLESDSSGELERTRLRNQTDFYSLFAGIAESIRSGEIVKAGLKDRLLVFTTQLEQPEQHESENQALTAYLDAVASRSNDTSPRKTRIAIVRRILEDKPLARWAPEETV